MFSALWRVGHHDLCSRAPATERRAVMACSKNRQSAQLRDVKLLLLFERCAAERPLMSLSDAWRRAVSKALTLAGLKVPLPLRSSRLQEEAALTRQMVSSCYSREVEVERVLTNNLFLFTCR